MKQFSAPASFASSLKSGSPLPRPDIAENVLASLGVPPDRVKDALSTILECAEHVGFIRTIKDKQYVELTSVAGPSPPVASTTLEASMESTIDSADATDTRSNTEQRQPEQGLIDLSRRVYITHGHNRDFVEPIKKLLTFGEMIPVVSIEKQTVSKPVPDKVMDDMRGCGAAIIHVDADETLMDRSSKERVVINPNVLIEIGGAMALYGRRFILLVRDGVRLPSNLQGLFEVRYKGETLDGDATIRLLEAINDIKNNPLPECRQA